MSALISRSGARDGVQVLARIGYAAKGFVYIAVGVLAAMAALSAGHGDAEGSRGALRSLRDEPLGGVMLALVAVGLSGYVIWQLVQAVRDPDRHGTNLKGLVQRAGMILSAITHAGLAAWSVGLVVGKRFGGDDDQGTRTWSARLLEQPFGAWLLGAIAVGIIIFGIAECVIAYRASYLKRFEPMPRNTRRWVNGIARTGLLSRGVVAWIVGIFLLYAAITANPAEARGLEGALQTLGEQPWGPFLLGTVAVGLVAYGVFEIVKARYRHVGSI